MLKTKRIRIVLLRLRNQFFNVEICLVDMLNFLFSRGFEKNLHIVAITFCLISLLTIYRNSCVDATKLSRRLVAENQCDVCHRIS